MRQVLLPTDFSNNAWNALAYAIRLFEDRPCNFFILHVAPLSESPVERMSFPIPVSEKSTHSKENLSELLRRIEKFSENPQHRFTSFLDYGNLVDAVRRKVTENHIDLIVMGTKGKRALKKPILGSNTSAVMTKVPCNTLAVPKEATYSPPKKIAFPSDFTIFYTYKILKTLTSWLQLHQSQLKVLHVLGTRGELSELQEKNKNYLHDYLEEAFTWQHSFHTTGNKKITEAIQLFVDANDIDIIVMVAKNLNFIQQLLFDSTVEKVSFSSKVPFLVLHG